MTEDYVPFTAKLIFTPGIEISDRAKVILQERSVSGLLEHDNVIVYTLFLEQGWLDECYTTLQKSVACNILTWYKHNTSYVDN